MSLIFFPMFNALPRIHNRASLHSQLSNMQRESSCKPSVAMPPLQGRILQCIGNLFFLAMVQWKAGKLLWRIIMSAEPMLPFPLSPIAPEQGTHACPPPPFPSPQVGGLRLEVAADEVNHEVHYFNRKTAEQAINYYITKMTAGPPHSKLLIVPQMCWMKK